MPEQRFIAHSRDGASSLLVRELEGGDFQFVLHGKATTIVATLGRDRANDLSKWLWRKINA